MRPLFWPTRSVRVMAAPLLNPPRDILLAAIVAGATVTIAWTTAMVAALIIIAR